jgi:hypothetical protein
MGEIKDDKLYTISELALLSGIREITLRSRLRIDKTPFVFIKGIIHIKGKNARDLLVYRQRGRKSLT